MGTELPEELLDFVSSLMFLNISGNNLESVRVSQLLVTLKQLEVNIYVFNITHTNKHTYT